MEHVYLIFVLGALLPFSITQQQQPQQSDTSEEFLNCFPNDHLTVNEAHKVSAQLTRSRLEFSIDFTKSVLKKSKMGANVFFSPHSVYQALLLAMFISNNKTENEIKSALRIPRGVDKLGVLRWFKVDKEFEKMRSLNGSASYELNNANKFFYQQSLPVRQCMKLVFEDELHGVDFKQDAQAAKQLIDQWVSNQTSNQINDLLADAEIGEDTKLILVNAMYFKGLWQSKFQLENTKKEVFFMSPSKTSLVPMMKQKGNFKYCELSPEWNQSPENSFREVIESFMNRSLPIENC